MLCVPSVRDLYSTLYSATPTHYLKLVSEYEFRLARIDQVPAQASDAKMIDQITGILEELMIRCTGKSTWFGGLIVDIPEHRRRVIKVSFPQKYKEDLTKMERLVQTQLQTHKNTADGVNTRTAFLKFFAKAYKIRATIVFSAFASIIVDHPSLDLTWEQFCLLQYDANPTNPYISNLSLLSELSPKLHKIFRIIQSLGKMNYVFPETQERLKVPEKLMIATTNPPIAYLIIKVRIFVFDWQIILMM